MQPVRLGLPVRKGLLVLPGLPVRKVLRVKSVPLVRRVLRVNPDLPGQHWPLPISTP